MKSSGYRKQKEIHAQFQELMSGKGIESYRQLALRSEISTATMSLLVRGKVQPSVRVTARLSSTLGINPKRLYDILYIKDLQSVEKAERLYQQLSAFSSLSADMLDPAYSATIGKLESLYHQSNPISKAQIIGGLELLVKLYEKAS